MISVIVPVYNVEPYLRKCLDSIINQTYQNLEILLVDDGSSDKCGEICDQYAKLDNRIKVFHTANRGLSEARNLGLDNAKGEYIGFVDPDDWIEPDMYELLLKRLEETKADIVECGMIKEYWDKSEESKKENMELTGKEALRLLLIGKMSNAVWNKLWKRQCFETVCFPVGRVYEDIATTYLIFAVASHVCIIAENKYHYLQREGSLSKVRSMENLIGYWLASKERYDFLYNRSAEAIKQILLRDCAIAIARTWGFCYDNDIKKRNTYRSKIIEMHEFTRQHFPLFGDSSFSLPLRIGVFFPHFLNGVSFQYAMIANHIYKLLKTDNKII